MPADLRLCGAVVAWSQSDGGSLDVERPAAVPVLVTWSGDGGLDGERRWRRPGRGAAMAAAWTWSGDAMAAWTGSGGCSWRLVPAARTHATDLPSLVAAARPRIRWISI
ncbi:hypothetical protein E2562_023885 [Oryza meyeriana var. granulata]|uniref:Uncharacterized protein n=1 Tax=Oryza meyeriana var. granulata TaxID=110450 RepID=A0A6G1D781_9ORYZ|nr:hypothetical protein E2562_023885 [Oryza meyeriana var. granulata]